MIGLYLAGIFVGCMGTLLLTVIARGLWKHWEGLDWAMVGAVACGGILVAAGFSALAFRAVGLPL